MQTIDDYYVTSADGDPTWAATLSGSLIGAVLNKQRPLTVKEVDMNHYSNWGK